MSCFLVVTSSTITRTQCELAIDECNQEQCEEVSVFAVLLFYNNFSMTILLFTRFSLLFSKCIFKEMTYVYHLSACCCFRNNVFTVIDAFSVPRFIYNGERKKFVS